MRKIILVIAVIAALGSTAYAAPDLPAAADYTADITITESRSFRGEEITAESPRTVTVTSDAPLAQDNAEFDAYIAVGGDGYRLVRREAR